MTYRSRVNSNAVVLIIHIGTRNHDVSAVANIKSIGIVTPLSITSFIVNCHIRDSQAIGIVDAHSLDWCIFDVEVRDG